MEAHWLLATGDHGSNPREGENLSTDKPMRTPFLDRWITTLDPLAALGLDSQLYKASQDTLFGGQIFCCQSFVASV